MSKLIEKGEGSNRILIIDQNPLELIGLKSLLTESAIRVHSDDQIVCRTTDKLIEDWMPNAILVDVESYDLQVDSYTRKVRRQADIPVLWLSASSETRIVTDAVIAGAAGCVRKADFNQIATAIDVVLDRGVFFPPKILADFVFEIGLFNAPCSRHTENLTERERAVLMMVREGATNSQIATSLNISIETVKVHVRSIREAFGAVSRRQLVPEIKAVKECELGVALEPQG